MGPSRRQRVERYFPIAIPVRLSRMRLPGDRYRNFFPRRCPAPDRVAVVALEYHMVANDRGSGNVCEADKREAKRQAEKAAIVFIGIWGR